MNRNVARIELDNGVSFTVSEASLPLLIGRDSSCDLRLPIRHVSRKHCELFVDNDMLFLRDISTNGTVVGDHKINGEAVSIDDSTPICLAGEVTIKVTPCAVRDQTVDRRSTSERRAGDRRQFNRRVETVVVDFERRRDGTRRRGDRRVAARRSASGA
jgi:pSer/pThr/pTyr-binding forkhead associated (FHA) protein|tara:strand:+ start:821 stop:1294 length:474 start_codon:yes stop_codon:yes gene_type:complete